MKKLLLISILCLFVTTTKAQDPVVPGNKKDLMMDVKMKEHITFGGKVFHISDQCVLRTRTYKKEYVQFTFIVKLKGADMRLYGYFSIRTGKVTPAFGIKKYI